MKIKTKKARLIVKAIVCIVLSLAILVPATMFSLEDDNKNAKFAIDKCIKIHYNIENSKGLEAARCTIAKCFIDFIITITAAFLLFQKSAE